MYSRSPEVRGDPEERDYEAIEREIKDKLVSLIEAGGTFYLLVTEFNGQVEKAPIEINYNGSANFARTKNQSRHSAGGIENIVRSITGGTQRRKVIYESARPPSPELIAELKKLDLEFLAAMGHADGTAVFHATHSIDQEPEGKFEPEKFLGAKHSEFRSAREKAEYFWKQLSDQINLINDIIIKIENSGFELSPDEIIEHVLGDSEIALQLSKEQRFRIKRKIYELAPVKRKIREHFEKQTGGRQLAAALFNVVPDKLAGNIKATKHGFYIDFFVENEEDYKLLESMDLLRFMGIDDKEIKSMGDSGGFKTVIDDIPITITKGAYDGVPLSPEEIRVIEDHEKRHAKNGFLMPEEKLPGIYGAKDEILAYLRDGTNLSSIRRELITFQTSDGKQGLYTYRLTGQAWEDHKKRVREYIDLIARTTWVNLDALALLPTNHWAAALENMDLLTENRTDENVVEIKLGWRIERERKVNAIIDSIRNNPGYTLTEAEKDYNQISAVVEDSAVLSFSFEDQIMDEYINNPENLAAINLSRDTEDLARELRLVGDYIDYLEAWSELDHEESPAIPVWIAYLNKLFRPLIANKDKSLKKIGEQLVVAIDGPCTITSEVGGQIILNTWKEKIEFVKRLIFN